MYEVFFMHMCGRKSFSVKFPNPVIDLIVERREEAYLFTVKGVLYQ